MINYNNITITGIQSVLHIQKNNIPGKIDFYTEEDGLSTYELIFRLFGEVETIFDGQLLENKKLTIQYLPKGRGNIEYKVKTIETGECIDIFFDTDVPLADTAFCIELNSPIEMKDLFKKINDIWIKKDIGYYSDAMSVLYKILSRLQKTENLLIENSHYSKIRTAIEYLNANFCNNEIDFEYVSSLCNMSYSYFRRLFTECIGDSPAKYVVNKKMEYAKELLSAKHYTVSEVAEIVGFNNVYYFSTTFSKIVGIPPSRYV